jgi:hypothetical protein
VKTLLSLKADYKTATGQEWKPGTVPQQTSAPSSGSSDLNVQMGTCQLNKKNSSLFQHLNKTETEINIVN